MKIRKGKENIPREFENCFQFVYFDINIICRICTIELAITLFSVSFYLEEEIFI